MAHEFIISFDEPVWYSDQRELIAREISALATSVDRGRLGEYRMQGIEDREAPDRWAFDVRIFMESDRLFVELSAHPLSIEKDLKQLIVWLRSQTAITVHDEDGETLAW